MNSVFSCEWREELCVCLVSISIQYFEDPNGDSLDANIDRKSKTWILVIISNHNLATFLQG